MEIAPGIYSLQELKGIFVHAFLVDDGEGLTLIDTLHSSDAAAILKLLDELGRSPRDIRRILLTHAHRAHLGGLAVMKEASGAPVYCHAWEADIVAGDRKQQCMSFLPKSPYVLWPFQVGSLFGRHRACQVDELLDDGDLVGGLQAVYTPGHTPGHLAFYWPEKKALFAGDSLVTWPEFGPGWPGFMLNQKQNWASLRSMTHLDIEVMGVGHGDPIRTGGGELLKALVQAQPQTEARS